MDLVSASKVVQGLNRWIGAEEATFLFRERAGAPWESLCVVGGEAGEPRGAMSTLVDDALPTSRSQDGGLGAYREGTVSVLVDGPEAFLLVSRGRPRRALGDLGLYLRFPADVGEEERAWADSLRETLGALLTAEGRYQRFVKEMESLLQILTHDLKSPANAVAGFVDIVFEDYGATIAASIAELLTRIRSSATRLQGILDGVYAIRRATFVPVRAGSVSLGGVIRDAYARARDSYRGVACEFIVSEDLPQVVVDAEKLEMVFGAIFDNAFKFRQKSQSLRIKVDYAALAANTHSVVIEDNSLGFEPRFQDAVFEPFRRLNPPGDYPGAGIGLTVARTCIDEHGGELRVNSTLGEGLRIYMSFRDLDV